jgi:hypothetical protein
MMDLYVDGDKTENACDQDQSLDALLDDVREANLQKQRAILEITCDGLDVDGQTLPGLLAKSVASFKRIDIRTGDPRELVDDALNDAVKSVRETAVIQDEVVRLFGAGKTSEAMKKLSDCVGQWHQINEVIAQSLALLRGHLPELKGQISGLVKNLEPVREKLTDIRQAVATGDFVLVADILEYEFCEVTDIWQNVLDGLIETLEPSTATAT